MESGSIIIKVSSIKPNAIAVDAVRSRKWYVVFRPRIFFITTIEEALVAGPAIKNTKTAPADTPFAIRTKATGIDAVAQT